MAKSNARKSAQTTAQKAHEVVEKFDIAAWATKLVAAATAFESGAKQLLTLALEARGKVEEDTAREKFQDAFAAALVATYAITDEEARKSKSCMNRVSDAMAVFKATELPASLPGNLQRAADAVRKAKRLASGQERAPRPASNKPMTEEEALADARKNDPRVIALGMVHNGLNQLRHAVDDAAVLELIGDLADLLDSVEEALGVQAETETPAV